MDIALEIVVSDSCQTIFDCEIRFEKTFGTYDHVHQTFIVLQSLMDFLRHVAIFLFDVATK